MGRSVERSAGRGYPVVEPSVVETVCRSDAPTNFTTNIRSALSYLLFGLIHLSPGERRLLFKIVIHTFLLSESDEYVSQRLAPSLWTSTSTTLSDAETFANRL